MLFQQMFPCYCNATEKALTDSAHEVLRITLKVLNFEFLDINH